MPSDGVKGKTWGPSTLHQRERTVLPGAMHRAHQRGAPAFSKSAPNLDKTRPHGSGTLRVQELGMLSFIFKILVWMLAFNGDRTLESYIIVVIHFTFCNNNFISVMWKSGIEDNILSWIILNL